VNFAGFASATSGRPPTGRETISIVTTVRISIVGVVIGVVVVVVVFVVVTSSFSRSLFVYLFIQRRIPKKNRPLRA
jgi:uncharacterized protein HemY